VCQLPITFPGPDLLTQSEWFYVVPELHTPLILGYTWLHSHNPRIDWVAGEIVLPAQAASFVATRPNQRPRAACDFLLRGQAYDTMLHNPRVHRTLRVWRV